MRAAVNPGLAQTELTQKPKIEIRCDGKIAGVI